MHTRQNALNQWLEHHLGTTAFTLTPLAGDASFRRYFRLHYTKHTHIIMDAPPDKEAITPFINIAKILSNHGIRTPIIHQAELTQGFLLLEDFGDELFLRALTNDNTNTLYQAAMTTLRQIQQCTLLPSELPYFDNAWMLQELNLFRDWFLEAYLELPCSQKEETLLENSFYWLTEEISRQPHVLIHRDYHSRNIMVVKDKPSFELGVLDFQDAMIGPFTYDLVSLLKDCYIQWPREEILNWVNYFYNLLPQTNQWSFNAFTRAFDLCGLQRHLKVLGIFCRLYLRDQKAAYLQNLPLTYQYVMDCMKCYHELQPLYQFMSQKVEIPFWEKQKQ